MLYSQRNWDYQKQKQTNKKSKRKGEGIKKREDTLDL